MMVWNGDAHERSVPEVLCQERVDSGTGVAGHLECRSFDVWQLMPATIKIQSWSMFTLDKGRES